MQLLTKGTEPSKDGWIEFKVSASFDKKIKMATCNVEFPLIMLMEKCWQQRIVILGVPTTFSLIEITDIFIPQYTCCTCLKNIHFY